MAETLEQRRIRDRARYARNPDVQRRATGRYWAARPGEEATRSKTRYATDLDRSHSVHRRAMLKRYGLTPERFEEILAAQGGCAICGATSPGGNGQFHVDHDHGCCPPKRACDLCFRGLLCHGCNTSLGHMADNPARLRAAADYLESRA